MTKVCTLVIWGSFQESAQPSCPHGFTPCIAPAQSWSLWPIEYNRIDMSFPKLGCKRRWLLYLVLFSLLFYPLFSFSLGHSGGSQLPCGRDTQVNYERATWWGAQQPETNSGQQATTWISCEGGPPAPGEAEEMTEAWERPWARVTQLNCSQVLAPLKLCELINVLSCYILE